ncbi:Anticodon-binding [Dillenia turbinata]|uniref:Histidine--tRNA ligase, cytoplasmic n=1 Tax=Dillenia turbinata TaxID=194707 RepID=A0AAN8W5R7_9MAGN
MKCVKMTSAKTLVAAIETLPMEEKREISVVGLGGKGSSLSSSAVFSVANGSSYVRIDSAVLDKLCDNNSQSLSSTRIAIPETLTREESRAYLVALLNRLFLSHSNIRPLLLTFLSDTLNRSSHFNSQSLIFDVTAEELAAIEKFTVPAMLDGISAIVTHSASVLSTMGDTVAALSCEAMRANASSFNLMDSGDGSVSKDEVGVASDLRLMLNGSKLVGKSDCDAESEIPKVHGSLREIVRWVYSKMRVELNSVPKAGSARVYANVMSALASALWNLGDGSYSRAKSNVNSVSDDSLKSALVQMLDKKCPNLDSLKSVLGSLNGLAFEDNCVKSLHELNSCLGSVRAIVAWEATAAIVSLLGSESIAEALKEGCGKTQPAQNSTVGKNGKNANAGNKGEKKKKVLGKGTTVILQYINDRRKKMVGNIVESFVLVEKWGDFISSFLDPKDPECCTLLDKVKEVLESNESRRLPKLPKGTRDFSREQMAIRERAFSIIVDVFKRHGATALDTPVFELRETLMGKYGEDSKLIYDLADQGGELCSLRYDLTVPFARYMAMNGLTSFKRYQIAKVYRRDNPSKGRYREFYQCDFDIAGQHETMGPDFEVIRILTELLDELNIGNYKVKLSHRKLLDGMMQLCGVPPEKFRTISSSIDKLDKQDFTQVKKEMVEEKGLTIETAEKIGSFVNEKGPPLELLSKLKRDGSPFLENDSSKVALKELEILFRALEKAECINKVIFDLSLARGLDYYTGVIYEAVFEGGQFGSIAAGGRYDNLIGMFGSKQVPAVGVSLGIERVFAIMEQNQANQAIRAAETQVLVSILGDDLSQAAELVKDMWNAKIKAEYMVNKRVMKHIDRAKESRIPWMVIVGERELNEGIVKLKDIEANKEEVVPRSKIVEELQRRLNSTSS